MKSDNRIVLWAGLGVGVVGLVIAYLNYAKNPVLESTPQGMSLSFPSNGATPISFQPAVFEGAPMTVTGNSGDTMNPGTSALFNFNPPAGSSYGTTQYGPAVPASAGCGCDSCDSACSNPGATVPAFGDPAAAAVGIMSTIGPAITAAFNAGQQIRAQQNYQLASLDPTGGSALYSPPGPIPSFGGGFHIG